MILRKVAVVCSLLGCIGSYFLSVFINSSSQDAHKILYEKDVCVASDLLIDTITSSLKTNSSVTIGLSSVENISIGYFTSMSAEYFSRNEASSVVYVSRYKNSSLSKAEEDLYMIYGSNTTVVPVGGSFVPGDLWIVLFSYPFLSVDTAFELNSEPKRGETIQRMVDSRSPEISPPLIVSTDGSLGVATIQPVVRNGNIVGAFASIFRHDSLIYSMTSSLLKSYPKIKMCIFINKELVYNTYETVDICIDQTKLSKYSDDNIVDILISGYIYEKFSTFFLVFFLSLIVIICLLLCVIIFIDREREYSASEKFKSDFISDISHEIRTPMNGILGISQFLKEGVFDKSENTRCLSIIQACGATLMSIINDVVDMSKMEAGILDIRDIKINLVQSVIKSIEHVWNSSNSSIVHISSDVELVVNVSGDSIPSCVICDDTRIQQILTNLLNNSVKFTEHGSIIINIVTSDSGNNAVNFHFEVKDTGIGMTTSFVKKAFSSFTRVDKNSGGTGLGLAVSQKLCNAMGCSLKCESVIGKGTNIWFDIKLTKCNSSNIINPFGKVYSYPIPIYSTNDVSIENEKTDTHTSLDRTPTVLVVDDIRINRLVLEKILTLIGINDVEFCTDGVYAVEKCKEKKYSAILMDMIMPQMSGVDASRKIKTSEDSLNKDTCIIFVSANMASDAYDICIESGGSDYISKPVSKEGLQQKLCDHMDNDDVEWIRKQNEKSF